MMLFIISQYFCPTKKELYVPNQDTETLFTVPFIF